MDYSQFFHDIVVGQALYIGKAILILFAGWLIIKFTVRITKRTVENKFEPTLVSFLLSAVKTAMYVLLIITAASTVGIEMTSFVAVLGAAGIAIGWALQGSLSNFAGGVLLLIIQPFKAGDLIEVEDQRGRVVEVQLLYTIIRTPDNKKVYIPNGSISEQTIVNYSANGNRRLDLQFGIGYDDNFQEAKEIINEIIEQHDKILNEPAPLVRLGEHADSSLEIFTKVWINAEDYWDVYYDLHEEVKEHFDEAEIGIPYPQLDVHFDSPLKDPEE